MQIAMQVEYQWHEPWANTMHTNDHCGNGDETIPDKQIGEEMCNVFEPYDHKSIYKSFLIKLKKVRMQIITTGPRIL